MTEEYNGETIEFDFYGFENHKSAVELSQGKVGKLIGIGNSMTPILKSRQPVICEPVTAETDIKKGDIVFCKVKGNHYLHKVYGIQGEGESFLIGNNHGKMNGWTRRKNVFGIVTKIL